MDKTPFDSELSSKLDQIVIALDAQPEGLALRMLRTLKWALETRVPAYAPEQNRRGLP